MVSAASRTHVRAIIPNTGDARPANDFYRTPPVATLGLLSVEDLPGPVWEPACGDGAISKVLIERGHTVRSSDLVERGYGAAGVDFLKMRPSFDFDCIVTNPPFLDMTRFAVRAHRLAPAKTCLVGRLLLLEGHRGKMFGDMGLTRVWAFTRRMNMPPDGYDKPVRESGLGGMVAFAWYVWERGHSGPTTVGWIDVNDVFRKEGLDRWARKKK
jgi:hypothetical protein